MRLQIMYVAAMITSSNDMAYMLAILATAVNMMASSFLMPMELMTLAPPVNWLKYISAAYFTFQSELLHCWAGCMWGCSCLALVLQTWQGCCLPVLLP
jgi:hypothetical protein